MSKGWIGVDFDGTLAYYTGWEGALTEKPPVKKMLELVKRLLHDGEEIRIFTARVYPLNKCVGPEEKRAFHGTYLDNSREDTCWDSIATIRNFCVRNLGVVLPITNVKDFDMKLLYDDRCVQVETNTGHLVATLTYELGIEQGKKDV